MDLWNSIAKRVENSGCSFCGKVCDPDLGDKYIITSMDGDYVCSQECKIAHEKEMDHFCGTVLNNDAMFAKWLGVPIDMLRTKPKEKSIKNEKPLFEEPRFNRYRALLK